MKGYTWTDRVHVLIYAPGWNFDSEKVDRIGESEGTPLTISSRESRVDDATFSETGPDTGVFFGVVKLTGQHYTVHEQNDSTVKAHGHTSSNFNSVEMLSGQGNCKSSTSGSGGGGGHHGFLIPLIMQMKGMLFNAIMMDFIPNAYAQHHMPDCSFTDSSSLDVAARLATDFQDGAVTVSWEANDDIVVTKSATWSWRIAELSF